MEAFTWTYDFMTNVTFPVYGYEISMWELFMFIVVAGLIIWIIKKIFLD